MIGRTCTICKLVKSIEDFHWTVKGKYRVSRCKPCSVEYNRKIDRKTDYKERMKVRRKDPYYAKKFLAKDKLHSAIKNGTVNKKPCLMCGKEKSEGHHEDYDKPLEVIWLCKAHHMELHANRKYNPPKPQEEI